MWKFLNRNVTWRSGTTILVTVFLTLSTIWHFAFGRFFECVYRPFYSEPLIYTQRAAEHDVVTSTLDLLSRPIIDSITSINITDHPTFAYEEGTAGYCTGPGARIFLRPSELSFEHLMHEIGHAYERSLPGAFRTTWMRVSRDVYLGDRWLAKINTPEPHDGLLTNYSAKDMKEDVAEYVAHCYMYTHRPSSFSMLRFLTLKHQQDHRYHQKIGLLFQYGFITQQQYDTIDQLFFIH